MDLREVLNEALREVTTPKEGEIWVTEVTVPCLRMSWYKRRYGDKLTWSALLGIKGHDVLIPRVAERLGCRYEERVEHDLGNGWVLVGRPDIICSDRVIELKVSQKPYIRSEWIEQANAYAYMHAVPEFTIVVVSDVLVIEDYKVSPELFKVTRDIAIIYSEYLSKGKTPLRNRGAWCNHCPYRKICLGEKTITEYR